MNLTDIKCKTAKPKDKPYKMFDGGGLYLEVLPTAKKLWRLKYYYLKKEKRISLGPYGKDMVAHGFRALARTTIREKLKYHSEIIEKQLAHKSPGPLGEAYDRTQFEDERKIMMQEWADYIDVLASEGKVIKAKFGS